MRMRVAVALVALLSLPLPALGDRLVTVQDRDVRGRVQFETLVLEAAEGELELPRSSIVEIRPGAELLSVRLVDGSWIEGRPMTPDISIQGELYTQRFEWADVRLVLLELSRESSESPSVFIRVDDMPRQTRPVERPPPLRLELDLDGVYELEARKRVEWTSSKLRLFYSDDVSIPVVRVRKTIDRESFITLEFEISVAVRYSFDRMVTLEMQLLAERFGGWMRRDTFEVEEGDIKRRKYYLRLSESAFDGVFGPSARPRLRFSVSATEA